MAHGLIVSLVNCYVVSDFFRTKQQFCPIKIRQKVV